jgi:nucleotide-binding universal stress UspA family protein
MGWGGRKSRRRDLVLGNVVDVVAREADADVLVERIGATTEDVDSILVPAAGGPHAEYATEVAMAIARSDDARVELVHVVVPDADAADRNSASEVLDNYARTLENVEFERRIVEGDDVVSTIVNESANHDSWLSGRHARDCSNNSCSAPSPRTSANGRPVP